MCEPLAAAASGARRGVTSGDAPAVSTQSVLSDAVTPTFASFAPLFARSYATLDPTATSDGIPHGTMNRTFTCRWRWGGSTVSP